MLSPTSQYVSHIIFLCNPWLLALLCKTEQKHIRLERGQANWSLLLVFGFLSFCRGFPTFAWYGLLQVLPCRGLPGFNIELIVGLCDIMSHLVVTLLPRIVTLLLPTWMSNSLLQGISSPISSHGSQERDSQDGMLKSWSKLLFVSLLSHVLMDNSGIGAQDVERWCFVWRHIFGNWHHRVRAGALWLLLVWTTGAQDVADRWCSFTFHLVTLTDTQCSLNVVIPSGHNTHAHKKKATLETHQKYYFSQL